MSCIILHYLFIGILIASVVASTNPRVLVVQAHPDDETMFAGLIFKAAHDLQGTVRYFRDSLK